MGFWVKLLSWAKEGLYALGSSLFEPECPICGTPIIFDPKVLLCPRCLRDLHSLRLRVPLCSLCALPLPDGKTNPCPRCQITSPALERVFAFWRYEGVLRSLLILWKHGGHPPLKRFLLRLWKEGSSQGLPPLPPYETSVIGVPSHLKRLRSRGFDPILPMSRSLVKSIGAHSSLGLVRTKDVPHQTLLSAKERLSNVRGSFALSVNAEVELKGRVILLVDDIMTTGATLNEAAKTLRKAKPSYIIGVVLARTLV